MVVTSLYTRNMLSTTLFPGCYNLEKPGDKLVSLHKVVTSCHKTLHKFETIKLLQNLFSYAVDMHVSYVHGVCWFEEHACNIHVSWPVLTCNMCVLHVCCMLHTYGMHIVWVAHSCGYRFCSSLQLTFLWQGLALYDAQNTYRLATFWEWERIKLHAVSW